MIIVFAAVLIYALIMGHTLEERSSQWAAKLFKSLFLIISAFLCTLCLNKLSAIGKMDQETYYFNWGICFFMALLGLGYLLPVMLGKGKKGKNKISNDAFK